MVMQPAAADAAACPAVPAIRFVPLGAGLWWVPAADGESNESRRGIVSNLLIARDGKRLWLVGSGPSPAFGQALACRARQHIGRVVADIVNPWARAELVLGNAGFSGVRVWAHRQVATTMAEQRAHCVERLHQRLGLAAADLGDQPARLPTLLLDGSRGRLGPIDWWALPRSEGRVVTVWRHRASGVTSAHGLLWFDGPPDGRRHRPADDGGVAASCGRSGRSRHTLGGRAGPARPGERAGVAGRLLGGGAGLSGAARGRRRGAAAAARIARQARSADRPSSATA